jgi:hypothetical protein
VPLKPAQRQTDVLRKFLTRYAGRGLTQRGTYVFQEVHVVDTEVVFGRLVHRIRLHEQREDRCSPGNANDLFGAGGGELLGGELSFALSEGHRPGHDDQAKEVAIAGAEGAAESACPAHNSP